MCNHDISLHLSLAMQAQRGACNKLAECPAPPLPACPIPDILIQCA